MSTRENSWKVRYRRALCILLSSLAIVTSAGLTGGLATAAPGGGRGGGTGKPTTTVTDPEATTTTNPEATTTTAPTDTGGKTGSKGVANPKLTAVVSLSRHRVLVTYDRDLDDAALQLSSYAFYSTEAVNLPVTAVARATNNQAFVMTGPQEPVTYEVENPKTSRPVTFTGSTAIEPKVLSATSVSKTQILVTFSEPMGTAAFEPSSYQITVEGSSAVLAVNGAAQFGSTQTQVLLTTAPQEAVPYVLTVGDIQSASGIYMDPTATAMQLSGSTVLPGPMLLSATSDGDTRVVLTFDTPLDPASATDPANYTGTPNLFIESATLQADNTQVVLVTSPQYQIDYSLVADVTGADGNPVNPAYNSASFRGNLPVNTERPKVTSAASTGNKSVLVQFSKPMADSTADASRFTIVQTVVHPEVGALTVTGAEFVGTDRLSVRLTTLSQAEVTYQVIVNNVTDLMGNPLADKTSAGGGVLVDPTSFTFPGTPPTGDERTNSDEDALWDHEETRGAVVTIVLANGETVTRQVTSSPFSADTDHDGLTDDTERSLNIDPRDDDTDDDALSDFAEYNEIFSDPANQDSDADTIFDGNEVTFFRTSPIQMDTDGDQRDDADEINVNRNPKVADTPRSALDIGEMTIGLDVRFEDTDSSGVSQGRVETSTATLSQSESKDYSTTDSRTIEAATRLAQTASVSLEAALGLGGIAGPTLTVGYEATHEQSSSLSFTSSFTESSSEATSETYEDSLTSSLDLTTGSSRTRNVEGGSIKVAAMLKSVGDIAFNMSNVQISALVQHPDDPSRLTPIATLEPESPPATGFSLGPLSPERGPVIFASKPDQVFPQQIEDLMRNPRSVVFRFSNYDITDEQDRNFAFTSQEIYDRTGGLVIDYGSFDGDADGNGDATENHRVATGIGRWVADTDGDGFISAAEGRGPRAADDDPTARWALFDADGAQIGLTLRETLQAAGLVEYQEEDQPTASLDDAQKENSYSVIQTEAGERVFRVRGAQRGPGMEWQIWTPTGLDRAKGLDDTFVLPGKTFRLTFVEDVDGDGLPGVLEWTNRCKDDVVDTDGDTLDDRFEITKGWNVSLGLWGKTSTAAPVFSSCRSADSDEDGLPDLEEAPEVITRDERNLMTSTARRPIGTTHPPVADEVAMLALQAEPGDFAIRTDLDPDGAGTIQAPLFMLTAGDPTVATNWVKAPTNDPLANTDPVKQAIGDPVTNPARKDTDGDGVDDGHELEPHSVTLEFATASDPACPDDPTQQCTLPLITSPEWKDSDGDSASDGLEALVGGDPTQSDPDNFADDDGDGLVNVQETTGWSTAVEEVSGNPEWDVAAEAELSTRQPCVSVCGSGVETPSPFVPSDPTKEDTDLDGLSDREEMELETDPTKPDTDGDGLTDLIESQGFDLATFGTVVTDPLDADTDDDRRSDGAEANLSDEFVVRLEGDTPYEVFTSPLEPDADFDLLVDGEEFLVLTDPGKADTDGDPRSDFVEADLGRNPLLPDMLVKMNFVRLFVTDDGEDDAGDFEFDLFGLLPDGTTKSAVHSYPDNRHGVAALTLPTCGDTPCRLGGPNPVIRIDSGQTLFFHDGTTLGRTVDIGSVSMTDKVPQQFGVKGHLYEREHTDNAVIDCWFDFPDPFATPEDGLGTVRGSEMKLGTNSMAIHRSGSCNIQSAFEFTLFVSYTAS